MIKKDQMWLLYNICFTIYALFALPAFALKGKFVRGASSRFGGVPKGIRERLVGRTVWWVHAVSVGEIGLAVRFADRLRARVPGAKILFTTMTAAGYEVARKIKNEEDDLLYVPLDFPFCVNRFIRETGPAALILFETELWPNLIRELSRRHVPVFLVNGRISDKAFPKYRRARIFLKAVLQKISVFCVQDERMRSRFLALGAQAQKVSVNGNMKYDWEPSHYQEELARPLRRAVKSGGSFLFIAGSTHEGEEELLFRMAPELAAKFPVFRMLVAPRHLTRLLSIEKAAQRVGVSLIKTSSLSGSEAVNHPAKAVFLLDQVGILAPLYDSADLVFIGGSLVKAGGHNLVEPAVYAKPILFGPNMDNFLEMSKEFRDGHAAVQVRNVEELKQEIERLIHDRARMQALGRAAQALARRHQGATEKNLDTVLSNLESKKGVLSTYEKIIR